MGTFSARTARLQELVGDGDLEARVAFDQVYAWNQHEGGWLNFLGKYGPKKIENHPGGGGSHYLTGALTDEAITSMQRLADHVLDDEDGSLVRAMADNAEEIASHASAKAPIEFGDLRESDHPTVVDDGEIVYDRPPGVPRLSEAELKAKRSLKSPHDGGTGERTYLPKSNPRHGLAHPAHGGPSVPKPSPTVDRRSETEHHDGDLVARWQEANSRLPYTHRGQHEPFPDTRSEPSKQLDAYLRGLNRARQAEAGRVYDLNKRAHPHEPSRWGGPLTPKADALARIDEFAARHTATPGELARQELDRVHQAAFDAWWSAMSSVQRKLFGGRKAARKVWDREQGKA